jgi:dCTP deaminase
MAESGPLRELPPGAKPVAASQAGRQTAPQTGPTTGILPIQVLRELLRVGEIVTATPLVGNQLQPASLDLRLGAKAHRVRAGFLPGRRRVAEAAAEFNLHEIDLTGGAVLETGCVYIVELQESLALSPALAGWANPKSSIGRLDVFVRLIVDHATEFDRVPAGYKGPLFAEISPQTFPVLVRQGSRLNQLRLGRGSPTANDAALRAVHAEIGLVGEAPNSAPGGAPGGALGDGPGATTVRKATLDLTIDLSGDPASGPGAGLGSGPGAGLVGFRARRHTALIDVDRVGAYEPAAFWDPLPADPARRLILDPNEFYILRSREPVKVPPDYAAEMVAYDTQIGEFRAHYAGFFDPGFGYRAADGSRDNQGTRAVLEVRSHKVPFILEHGQIVGRLVYERMAGAPDELYGAGMGSSYQSQGLKLSKHFKAFSP